MAPSELSHESFDAFKAALEQLCTLAIERQSNLDSLPTTASNSNLIKKGVETLPTRVPNSGWGLEKSSKFLLEEVASLLNPGQAGSRYYGFVTGGTLPSALLSDWFTTLYDQNVQVHLPNETLSTVIEAYTLEMIICLLGMDPLLFTGTFTTGATSSNLLALICAREATIKQCMKRRTGTEEDWSVAEHGLSGVGSLRVKVFVCQAHASIKKTAALSGIGRLNVIDVGKPIEVRDSGDASAATVDAESKVQIASLEFDMVRLDRELKQCYDAKEPAIVVAGMGEVVTGALADQTLEIRKLCNEYQAWLHMDAAFSATVSLVEGYSWMSNHMNVCDSVTSDGHKSFNVPYDCGILLIKKHKPGNTSLQCPLDDVCGPGMTSGPSYLASSTSTTSEDASIQFIANTIPSPLNRNLENSRRFRALPLYISLLSQGKEGVKSMTERNLSFTKRLRSWIAACPYYQLLTPLCPPLDRDHLDKPQKWKGDWATIVIFFRAHPLDCPIEKFRDIQSGHLKLIEAIKDTRNMYVSPGSLHGIGGVRIAVSNWSTAVNGDKDFDITTATLLQVMEDGLAKR